MRMVLKIAPVFLAVSLLAPAATYEIDPVHSTAQFKIRHLMVSNVSGAFSKISGTVDFDEKNLGASALRATIDTASISTQNEQRDNHLRSADFFDVAKYPTMTFTSKRFVRIGPGKYQIIGDLTLRGITREVMLDVDGPAPEIKDGRGGIKSGASATTKINRKDFGLTWNSALEAGGVAVGDEVNITLEVELNRKNATAISEARRP